MVGPNSNSLKPTSVNLSGGESLGCSCGCVLLAPPLFLLAPSCLFRTPRVAVLIRVAINSWAAVKGHEERPTGGSRTLFEVRHIPTAKALQAIVA